MVKTRIFVSAARTEALPEQRHRDIKVGILTALNEVEYEPQEFLVTGLPANKAWSCEAANDVMQRCRGAIIMALPRLRLLHNGEPYTIPSAYNHFEGALAVAHDVPTLIITERGVEERGIVWPGGGKRILFLPYGADADWLNGNEFKQAFKLWRADVESRKHVFLGYCSQAKQTAQAIQLFLQNQLGLSVLDWEWGFHGGRSILEEIKRAADCLCGIFLFTKDDLLAGKTEQAAAPRDNVVFEAGFFMHAKGEARTLIIREEGAKMPADLGGNIYLHLKDRNDITSIHTRLRNFLESNL